MHNSDDLDREIREHIEIETHDNIARGMTPEEARFAALRKFGNIGQIKEDTRAVWTWAWLESLAQDIRYAFRSFYRAPLFALTVVGTIGLALGLNTALFTIFNAYVLRPFAVHDPYSLYRLTWSSRSEEYHPITPAEFDDLQRAGIVNSVFSETLGSSLVLTRARGYQMMGEQVSGNYFQMLKVKMAFGRPILPDDSNAMVVSDVAWRNKFASEPNILGQKVTLFGTTYEIVGVTAPEFSGTTPGVADVWIPLVRLGPDAAKQIKVIGRLKFGISPKQGQAALLTWARQETFDRPDPLRATAMDMESAATSIPITPQMMAVFSPVLIAFGLVLVIACANVANMMLARGMARQREIGVRLSLGAGRLRLGVCRR